METNKSRIPTKRGDYTVIAEILSDMDAEISALEGKLVKARQVKAGMMSDLLSGEDQVGVSNSLGVSSYKVNNT